MAHHNVQKTPFSARFAAWWSSGHKITPFFLLLVLPASIWWWRYAGARTGLTTLLAAVSLACFMIGSLVGFLFSSYGEETNTIGKIRDWLVGGITGVTLAEAARSGGAFKTFLLKFTPDPNVAGQFGLVLSMAVVYFSLGFLFMFFQRELILNVVLARSRAERGQLDGTKQTALAIQKLFAQLPPSVLSGITDIGDADVDKDEEADLRTALYSDDVTTFLKQADDALKGGAPLSWDDISKVAHIHYYRTYFNKDQQPLEVKKALDWITRALALNPLHADLTMKYADMLGTDKQLDAAIAVLEHLAVRAEAPFVVNQWLGFYLRAIPTRVDDSISCSKKFLALFPDDSATQFNLAYAYGVKYTAERKKGGKASEHHADKDKALHFLAAAAAQEPTFKTKVEGWLKKEELAAIADDFKEVIDKEAPSES
jgi:tetratricopeptide (TPR) repeat protein